VIDITLEKNYACEINCLSIPCERVFGLHPDIHAFVSGITLWWWYLARRKAALTKGYPNQYKYDNGSKATTPQFLRSIARNDCPKKVIHNVYFEKFI
jgi:hypothetical protein